MFKDCQLAVRRLTKTPAFSVLAILTLAHALGANTAVRLALGASAGSIVRLVVRQALAPVVAGLCVGLIATQWLKRIAEAQLYAVDVRDPASLVAAGIAVLSATVLAAYLPARRASRTDPAAVLRSE